MRWGQRTLQHQRIEHAACPAHKDPGNFSGADANPPAQPFGRTAEYLRDSSCGLFVLLYKLPVRIHLEARLFTVRFDEHLVIPLTIGIVFP